MGNYVARWHLGGFAFGETADIVTEPQLLQADVWIRVSH